MIIGLKMWPLESTHAKKFHRGQILKLACFVPMFHLVTLGVEPILTAGISYEQNLVEVHKEMLHTKYQSSAPFSISSVYSRPQDYGNPLLS